MKRLRVSKVFCAAMVTLASVGMLLPQFALAIGPMPPTPGAAGTAIRDVALQDDGLLQGEVLDMAGAPAAGVPVAVVQQGKVVATAKTDANGRFQVAGLQAGVYQLATAQGGASYRLWSPRTAPPVAAAKALIVNNGTVVRGAMGNGGLVGFLSNPWVLGGIVAAAIAIPLALDNDDGS